MISNAIGYAVPIACSYLLLKGMKQKTEDTVLGGKEGERW